MNGYCFFFLFCFVVFFFWWVFFSPSLQYKKFDSSLWYNCIFLSRLWDSLKSSLKLNNNLNQHWFTRNLFSSQPSNSNAGGVGFYVNKELNYTTRSDLSSTTDEFEASQASSQKKSERKRNIIYNMTCRHRNDILD